MSRWLIALAVSASGGCVRSFNGWIEQDSGARESGARESGAVEGVPVRPPPSREAGPSTDVGVSVCSGVTCPLGCAPEGRCLRPLPSSFDPRPFHDKLTAGASSAATQIDGDAGEVLAGRAVMRPPGNPGTVQNGVYWDIVSQGTGYPKLAVFGFNTLSIPAGTVLKIVGTSSVALYVASDLVVAGTVSLRPAGKSPGPGGYAGGASYYAGASCFGGEGKGGASDTSDVFHSGGGGGGRKSGGGKGGTAQALIGAAGGAATGNDTLVPLFGGCGGGGGGWGGPGGGGGGAVQLVSARTLTVGSTGLIEAPGAAGQGGAPFHGGGGGGGSGGTILLEAASIVVLGTLAANGGSGGGGYGKDGQDGQASATAAAGGSGGVAPTPGGIGGAGGVLAAEAGQPGADNQTGGGGGGSTGRIRLNAGKIAGVGSGTGMGLISPQPSTSTSIPTW